MPPMTKEVQNSGSTSGQIELFIKLENIFMPHSRRHREEAYRNQGKSLDDKQPIRFVHYTSASAALSIINSKRIWMRNASCMDDYQEVQHGFSMLKKFFFNGANKGAFIDSLNACVPGAANDGINLFKKWWNHIRFSTYITSISEHDQKEDTHGRLSMWRAFGGNTARVALVFDLPWYSDAAQALNLLFSPVAYLAEPDAHAVINEVVKNIETNCAFLASVNPQLIIDVVFNMLVAAVTCLKHEGFREEREWRAIYFPKMRPSDWLECATEVVGGVPQPVYKLPLDVTVSPILADLDLSRTFYRLIIGPSPYPTVMYEAFVDALTKAKIPEPEERVFASRIPIRS
jgi:hypothetical protein